MLRNIVMSKNEGMTAIAFKKIEKKERKNVHYIIVIELFLLVKFNSVIHADFYGLIYFFNNALQYNIEEKHVREEKYL